MRYYLSTLSILLMTLCNAIAQPGLSYIDINPSITSAPGNLVVSDDKLYFAASISSTVGAELFVYNDTAFPHEVFDLNPGTGSSTIVDRGSIKVIGDTVYFIAHATLDSAIYKLTPGSNKPIPAARIRRPLGVMPASVLMDACGDHIVYSTRVNDTVVALVKENKASLTPDTLLVLPGFTLIREIVAASDRVYITTFHGYAPSVNIFDLLCINTTTKQVDTIGKDRGGQGYTGNKLVYNNELYFYFDIDPLYGNELYKHDGVNPPQRLTDLAAGSMNGATIGPDENTIAVHNNKIYFVGSDGSSTSTLAEYDIATKSTKIVPVAGNEKVNPRKMVSYHNKLFFAGTTPGTGEELYCYDGTNPIKLVADIESGKSSSMPDYLTVYRNNLYLSATRINTIQRELFIYNDSTLTVKNIGASQLITTTLYPNPTDNDAHLAITLPQAQSLHVSISDMNGRIVFSTQQKLYSAGKHNIPLHTQKLPAGNYIYTIRNEENTLLQSGKMVKQ